MTKNIIENVIDHRTKISKTKERNNTELYNRDVNRAALTACAARFWQILPRFGRAV